MKERLPILSKMWLGIKYQMDLGLARHLLSQLIQKYLLSEKSMRIYAILVSKAGSVIINKSSSPVFKWSGS